jgi:type IV pilus assembly protein PilE
MRRDNGFTLIELMVALAVVAILTVIAFPSYQRYIQRGIRAQGQVFLMDLSQRQEQFFLDQRGYATDLGAGVGQLANMTVPVEVAKHYTLQRPFTVSNAAGAPPTYTLMLTPNAGDMMATANDGNLLIDNLGTRWREVDANLTYSATNDCRWEESSCKAH